MYPYHNDCSLLLLIFFAAGWILGGGGREHRVQRLLEQAHASLLDPVVQCARAGWPIPVLWGQKRKKKRRQGQGACVLMADAIV